MRNKIINYIIIFIMGIFVGAFLGCSIFALPSSKEKCKEFVQIDYYEGNIRYTYVPELNECK